jgi:Tol biopolymer transport system component
VTKSKKSLLFNYLLIVFIFINIAVPTVGQELQNVEAASQGDDTQDQSSVSHDSSATTDITSPTAPNGGSQQSEAVCGFSTDNAGDDDPFSFAFSVNNPSDGSSYAWDFGDGQGGDGLQVSHVFAAEGQFTVSLTCSSADSSETQTSSASVSVVAPVEETPTDTPTETPTDEPQDAETADSAQAPEETAEPSVDAAGREELSTCQLDLNDSGDSDPFSFTFTAIATATFDDFLWDFGDGTTPTGQGPLNHTYAATGDYAITLTCVSAANGDLNLTGSVSIVNVISAGFTVTPGLSGLSPFNIGVVNTSSGAGLSYLWQVTGPEIHADRTDMNPSYTFTAPGDYTITLTVSDSGGQSAMAFQTVSVVFPPPDADFSVNPASGTTSDLFTVLGIDNGGGPITTWTFDWGDGSPTVSGQGPHTHFYAIEGTYWITMNYDGPGGLGSVARQIGVYAPGETVFANFTFQLTGNGVGGTEVCYTNTSTGPIVLNRWNFGDGTIVVDNSAVVCHTYLDDQIYTVTLHVEAVDSAVFSDATLNVNVIGAPVAVIGTSTTNVTYGGTVNFTGSGSTGIISTYEWDFGTSVSTVANPSNIAFTQLGNNPVRLTVTGPGGSSYAEVIIVVSQLDLTCNFTGNLLPPPGSTATYDATVGNVAGRTITYAWTITGPQNYSFTTEDISVTWSTAGAYYVTFTATADNGATCSTSKTVQVDWPDLTCAVTGAFAVLPDGTTHTYTVNVTGAAGRSLDYQWFVNGLDQGVNASTIDLSWVAPTTDTIYVVVTTTNASGNCTSATETIVVSWPNLTCSVVGNFTPIPNGSSYTYTANVGNVFGRTLNYQWFVDGADQGLAVTANSIDLSWVAEGPHTIYVVVTTTDGSGNCTTNMTQQINVVWPPLTCGISGPANPIPNMPDQNRNHTYTANLTNTNGLTPAYQWFINGVLQPLETGSSMTLSWEWFETGNYVISYTATTTGPGGGNCGNSRNVNVNVPALTCAAIVGDLVPVVGETETYQSGITNAFGRTVNYAWTLELEDPVGVFTTVATGSTPNIAYTFNIPGASYRITYTADVIEPTQNCTRTANINVSAAGVTFSCDGWVTGAWAAPSPAGNYDYSILVDNSNGYILNYEWVLSNSAGSRTFGPFSSTVDGTITETLTGLQLGPADTYDLVVNVSSPDTPYTCSFPAQAVVVGTLNVQYTYTVNLAAIGVGEQICLTNASDTSHGDINSLTYSWDLGTSDNTLSNQVIAGQTLSCFSFNTPGAYSVTLTGTTPGGQTGTFTRTFNVYGLQSISIDRSNATYAGSLIDFDAIGVNITGAYNWTFYDSTNTIIGTRTGQNVNFFFANPDTYRAVVSGTGPLGTTTAEVSFELIGLNDIRAAFVPSTYGGLAPITICYTDNSFGVGINSWTWNFGNGQTLTYDNTNIPSQICSDYVTPGQVHNVTLTVSNGTLSANASNVVRTYNVVESNAAFSIEPRGNGEFCFNPVLGTGINVTMWDFGDGITLVATNNGQVCHNYQSSGYYLVTMSVSDGGTTGEITRPVDVDLTTPVTPSNLAVSATCTTGPVGSFTVSNSGGTMTTPDKLTIRNAAGQVILVDDFFQLANGASRTYDIVGHGGTISLSSLDTSLAATMNCPYPPQIEVTAVCEGQNVAFVIANLAGSMSGTQSYEIRDISGNLVGSGDFSLAQGAANVVLNTIEPYGTYSFSSSGVVGTFNLTHACEKSTVPSYVEVEALCSMTDVGVFRITNIGSDMLSFQNVTVTNADGTTVSINHSMFKLNDGGHLDIEIDDFDPYAVYTLTTSGEAGDHTVLHNCLGRSFNSDTNFLEFYGLSSDVLDLPNWGGVDVCGYGCVPWRVYHTNETGNWEIFRLDGADEVNEETFRLNLSQGVGEGVDDYAPSRSPNAEWIVFSSNRDGNWEIYVAPTNGDTDLIQRVTFNSIAIDTDPVWGPNNYVVYESTRDGNWELYMVDMETGHNFRLTDHEANDINPFWSPDGSKLLFQSDRDGVWQIYELDLNNFTVKRLSDGNGPDVDPQYNFAGDQIAFRSYRIGDKSVIYVMDADGENVYPVTMPAEDATNHTWSPDDSLIAYQSDFDGDLDIYVYEVETGEHRLLTDNTIDDYAPTWICESTRIVFTSDIMGDPNIFEDEALPINDPAVMVEEHSDQMTFELFDDIYPQNMPAEENASREGQTVDGAYGTQTEFLMPDASTTQIDLSFDGIEVNEDWLKIEVCPIR